MALARAKPSPLVHAERLKEAARWRLVFAGTDHLGTHKQPLACDLCRAAKAYQDACEQVEREGRKP